MRKAMAAAYAKDRDALGKAQEGVAPYNSTKLSPEQEAHAYANPDWLYPPSKAPEIYQNLPVGATPDEIQREVFRRCRIAQKQEMGAAEYVAFIKRTAGGG